MTVLTPRQRQVLQLAANGLTHRQIADRLTITRSSVSSRLSDTYARLGVANQTSAVLKAANLGLIEPVCLGCRELHEENRELRRQIAQQHRALELLDSPLDEPHDLARSAGAHT